MTICRDLSLIKTQGAIATAEPLKCRSWCCEFCAPERRKRLIAQAIGGKPNTYIVLTCNPKFGLSPEHRARMLVSAWRCVREWYKGKHDFAGRTVDNGSLPFLAVFERHKSGEPHLNILCRSEWIPWPELSSFMKMLNGAQSVTISRIDDAAKTAAYCAKYCGKDPAKFGTCKRYWCSQDYDLTEYESEREEEECKPTYSVFRGTPRDWLNEREREGWRVWEQEGKCIAQNLNLALRAIPPPSLHRSIRPAA